MEGAEDEQHTVQKGTEGEKVPLHQMRERDREQELHDVSQMQGKGTGIHEEKAVKTIRFFRKKGSNMNKCR